MHLHRSTPNRSRTTPRQRRHGVAGLALLAGVLLALGALGCEGELPGPIGGGDDPDPRGDVTYDTGWPIAADAGSPAPQPDSAPTPTPDTAPPPPSCPEMTGTWSGTLGGTVTGAIQMEVAGNVWVKLTPTSEPGNYTISSGEMSAWATILPIAQFKYALTGKVTCGVLQADGDTDIFGVPVVGTTSCTAEDGLCKGFWTGKSKDGSSDGKGTFVLRKE